MTRAELLAEIERREVLPFTLDSGDPLAKLLRDRANLEQVKSALRGGEAAREALEECRHFLAGEYCSDEASAMQGHPIDKVARKVWDQTCEALAALSEVTP